VTMVQLMRSRSMSPSPTPRGAGSRRYSAVKLPENLAPKVKGGKIRPSCQCHSEVIMGAVGRGRKISRDNSPCNYEAVETLLSRFNQNLDEFRQSVNRRLDANESLLRKCCLAMQRSDSLISDRPALLPDEDNLLDMMSHSALLSRRISVERSMGNNIGDNSPGSRRARTSCDRSGSVSSPAPIMGAMPNDPLAAACMCHTTGLVNISSHEQSAPQPHNQKRHSVGRQSDFDESAVSDNYIPEEELANMLDPDAFTLPPMPRGVLHPDMRLRVSWDFFMLAMLAYVCVSVPLVICFVEEQSTPHAVFDLIVDALFILDIVLNFRTAFFTKARTLCTDLQQISVRYYRSWFLPDVVSSIPVQMIFMIEPSASQFIALKLVRLIKIGRLSRVGRIKALRDLQYNGVLHPAAFQLVKLLVLYFFVLHMVACFYWYVAVNSLGPEQHGPDCDDFTKDQGRIAAWSMCAAVTSSGLGRQYSRAFFTAVLIMVGGDTFPTTPSEEVFTATAMLIGIFTNSVIIGSCASLLGSMGKQAAVKQDHFDRINSSLSYNKVSTRVKMRVRAFIEYLYGSGNMNSEDLYRFLPQSLRTALEMEMKKPLISAVGIFKDVGPACTVAIVHALQQVFMPPREYIVVQGQFGYCMYFISRGVVQVTVVRDDVEQPLGQLTDGSHFGEGALVGDHHRNANVLTLSHCEMEKLDQASFEAICERHEELALVLQQRVQERAEASARKAAERRAKKVAEREEEKRKAQEPVRGKWKMAVRKLRDSVEATGAPPGSVHADGGSNRSERARNSTGSTSHRRSKSMSEGLQRCESKAGGDVLSRMRKTMKMSRPSIALVSPEANYSVPAPAPAPAPSSTAIFAESARSP